LGHGERRIVFLKQTTEGFCSRWGMEVNPILNNSLPSMKYHVSFLLTGGNTTSQIKFPQEMHLDNQKG
jgi:hypothetical protein